MCNFLDEGHAMVVRLARLAQGCPTLATCGLQLPEIVSQLWKQELRVQQQMGLSSWRPQRTLLPYLLLDLEMGPWRSASSSSFEFSCNSCFVGSVIRTSFWGRSLLQPIYISNSWQQSCFRKPHLATCGPSNRSIKRHPVCWVMTLNGFSVTVSLMCVGPN